MTQMVFYSPKIEADYMGAPAPVLGGRPGQNMDYFQDYRNENLSRITSRHYEWGMMDTPYCPNPEVPISGKSLDKYSKLPPSQFSMIDKGRQQEVDDFYIACQLHRDQYKDHTGRMHPLDYFKTAQYLYQCPTDPTSKYFKYPEYYVKYKQPITLPLTTGRTMKTPLLPDRALTGIYDPSSCMKYKR